LAKNNEGGSGGYLISTSADGSICVTDLKSEAVTQKLASAASAPQANTSAKRRTDQFMHEKSKNMRLKRRHSVTQYFTAQDFFQYERVSATQVFSEVVFSEITHVFRVKSLTETHDFLVSQKSKQNPRPQLELPKQYYAFLTSQ